MWWAMQLGVPSSPLTTSHLYLERRQEMVEPKQPRGTQPLLNLTTSGTVSEDVEMWRWSSWSGMDGFKHIIRYSLSLSGTGGAASSSWCSGAMVRV